MTWWLYIIEYLLCTVGAVPIVLRRWMAWPVCSRCGRSEGSDAHYKCQKHRPGGSGCGCHKCMRFYSRTNEFKPRGALFARTDRDARYVLGLSALWLFLLSFMVIRYALTRTWRGLRTLVLASVRPSLVELERITREQAAEIEKRTNELKSLHTNESANIRTASALGVQVVLVDGDAVEVRADDNGHLVMMQDVTFESGWSYEARRLQFPDGDPLDGGRPWPKEDVPNL